MAKNLFGLLMGKTIDENIFRICHENSLQEKLRGEFQMFNMLNCSAGVTTSRDVLYNFTYYRNMKDFIILGWSTRSPSLSLDSQILTLSISESRLLRELVEIYELQMGWYDPLDALSIEFEQSGRGHSKRVFLDWAKDRRTILMDQYERRVLADL